MSKADRQQSYGTNTQIRTAVNRLTNLLEWLHPDPSPDIFTVRDYHNRYPFTRLGPLAAADIDRYQRINRAIGNHVQMGLYNYHIGLIYLYEGAFRGAVTQFDQARQQWSFVNQSGAVALTHLARAVALQQAGHYESALVSAGKVAGWLERARLAKPIQGWTDFEAQVLAYVTQLQAELRQQMDVSQPAARLRPDETGAKAEEAAQRPQTGLIEPDPEAETRPEGDIVGAVAAPRPISNMDSTAAHSAHPIPIPDRLYSDDRHAWYLVEIRPQSDFMPDIHPGDWLLVDLQPRFSEDLQDTEQPILVVKKEEIEGTIRVRPLERKDRYPRIYLVTLADSPTGSFWRDEATGTVTFSVEMAEIGIDRTEILGVVVGFWRPMIAVLPENG